MARSTPIFSLTCYGTEQKGMHVEPPIIDTDAPTRRIPTMPPPPRRRHSRSRDIGLLVIWLVALFLGSTLLIWRLAVARLPSLPVPANPAHLVLALVAAVVGGALIGALVAMYPSAGLIVLAATVPLEEVLYISIGSFRVKPYEAILLGLTVALLIRRRLRVDRLSGVLLAYVLFGVVSIGFDPGASLFTSLQVIAFELLMALLFIVTRASLVSKAWTEAPWWLARIIWYVKWRLTPVTARLFSAFPRLDSRLEWTSDTVASITAVSVSTSGVMARVRRMTLFYVLVVGNGVALYGAFQFVGYYLGLPIPYFHPEVYAIFRPYATFIEPNPFGTFLTGQLALALTLALSPAFRRWRVALVATLMLQVVLLAVNLSRGSWLAAAVVVLVLALIRFRGVIHFRRAPDLWRMGLWLAGGVVALVAVGGVVALLVPTASNAILGRIASFTNLNGGTLHWRTSDFVLALQVWMLKPVIGYGPGTWGAAAYGFVGRTAATAPRNIITAWLFERGLVGALLIVGFYKLFAERAIRAYRFAPSGEYRTLVLAYGLAAVAVFVGFLSASAEIVPYYWFQLGVLAALTDALLPTRAIESEHAHRT